MNTSLLLMLSVIMAPWLGPNIRIDHQNQRLYGCCICAITIGPGAPTSQPIYVAFEDKLG
jgi:hypothetical protein